MEVLEVSGYVSEEKAVIADKYLGPQAKHSSGLKNADVTVDAGAIDALIKYYCRESGVRNLKKHIEKVSLVHSFERKPERNLSRYTGKLL
jgi:Lon-like ATP-dependent protease